MQIFRSGLQLKVIDDEGQLWMAPAAKCEVRYNDESDDYYFVSGLRNRLGQEFDGAIPSATTQDEAGTTLLPAALRQFLDDSVGFNPGSGTGGGTGLTTQQAADLAANTSFRENKATPTDLQNGETGKWVDAEQWKQLQDALVKNNTSATAPSATNDSSEGYAPFSRWFDSSTNQFYTCVDATAGAAVWRPNA